MTDMITVSRKEIEKLRNLTRYSFLSPSEGGVRRFQDKSGAWVEHYEMFKIIEDLLDKAEVSEPVGEIKISWGSDTGYEYGLTLIGGALGSQKEYDEWIVKNFNGEGIFKLYTSPRDQSAKIAELEAEIAKLTAIIENMKVEDNVFSKSDLPYGICPVCGGAGLSRERRPNGNDKCVNGHVYPSREARSMFSK